MKGKGEDIGSIGPRPSYTKIASLSVRGLGVEGLVQTETWVEFNQCA